MATRQSRLSTSQRDIMDALKKAGFIGRWWGPTGHPACRLYIRRLNTRGLKIVEPVKVYLEFDSAPALTGARLVVGRASKRINPTQEQVVLQRSLAAIYARATYIAKTYDSPTAMSEYLRQCRVLSLPSGNPDEGETSVSFPH